MIYNTKVLLSAVVILLSSLACSIQKGGSVATTPVTTPTTVPADAPTATATPRATEAAVDTAVVRAVSVNVRQIADGDPTGEYVYAGQSVVILQCVGDWCQIEEPAGWVWRGCLSDNPDGLKCEAK
jgi:hypothetical protein